MNIIMMKLKAPAPKRKHVDQTCYQNIAVSCNTNTKHLFDKMTDGRRCTRNFFKVIMHTTMKRN